MPVKIKAVLFDMDGVLVEAKDWHYEALNRALDVFGLPISRSEHLSQYDGLPTRTKLKMLTEKKGLPPELHKFLNDLKQRYTTDIIQRTAIRSLTWSMPFHACTQRATKSPCARIRYVLLSK